MVSIRSISLLLGLLLSLVALQDYSIIGTVASNDQEFLVNQKGVGGETVAATAATKGTWLIRGRKMGAEQEEKEVMEVRSSMKSGNNAKHSSEKTVGLSIPKLHDEQRQDSISTMQISESSATHDSVGSSSKSKVSTSHGFDHENQRQPVETQKLLHATAQIFNMLAKDYNWMAHRRPPINNDQPLSNP